MGKLVRTRFEGGSFAQVPNVDRLECLSAQAQAVFLHLCVYADSTGLSFPRRETLAKKIQLKNARSVDKYIKELEDNVFIAVIRRKNLNTKENLPNLYRILAVVTEDEEWKADPRIISDDEAERYHQGFDDSHLKSTT